jgi:hypothetical protein
MNCRLDTLGREVRPKCASRLTGLDGSPHTRGEPFTFWACA